MKPVPTRPANCRPPSSRHAEHQRADAAGAPALTCPPAADDHFLGLPELVLDPRRRPSPRLIGGVPLLGDDALPPVLRGRTPAPRARRRAAAPARSARHRRPAPRAACGGRSTWRATAIGRRDAGCRTPRTRCRVERARFCISPKLGTPDSSSATDLAVEDHVMVGEIGGQRLELGVFVGDVAAAARTQFERAVIGVDQQPVAVPLALERPLPPSSAARTEPCGRQHRREIASRVGCCCSFIRCASQFLPSVWISA